MASVVSAGRITSAAGDPSSGASSVWNWGVAAGDAGAAVADQHLDLRRRAGDEGDDLLRLVPDDAVEADAVSRLLQQGADALAAEVVGFGTGVGDGEDADAHVGIAECGFRNAEWKTPRGATRLYYPATAASSPF